MRIFKLYKGFTYLDYIIIGEYVKSLTLHTENNYKNEDKNILPFSVDNHFNVVLQ